MNRFTITETFGNPVDLHSNIDLAEPFEQGYGPIISGQSVFLDAYRRRNSSAELSIGDTEQDTYEHEELDSALCVDSEENFLGFLRLSIKNEAALDRAKTVCQQCADSEACLEIGMKIADKHFNPYAIYGGMIVKDILLLK